MEICNIENLTFTYPDETEPALQSIDLSINAGEFIVLFGESGSGKTTLLRLLKKELAPHGEKSGKVQYKGTALEELDEQTAAGDIGFVMQNPETQIVTDKVWHELAFGLENIGASTSVIRRRVGELANYFGIHTWFREKTTNLSGGQKQLLNVSSIMAMQPEILILDEPTSQLDPIAASNFIQMLEKLNQDFGLTIVMVEHRLEEVLPLADKVVLLENGKIICNDHPRNIGNRLKTLNQNHPMLHALPTAMLVYQELGQIGKSPLTVREGKEFLSDFLMSPIKEVQAVEYQFNKKAVLQVTNAWFRYERDLPDIVRGADIEVYKGEIVSILGGNGSGKTTLLTLLAGQHYPYRGNVFLEGKKTKKYGNKDLYRHNIAVLPQDPQTVFIKNTVRKDYEEILHVLYNDKTMIEEKLLAIAGQLSIIHLLDSHPYDLSGGEQQKAALGKILLLQPNIIMLDEPTKGMDAFSKQTLQKLLRELQHNGKTIIIITHDVEFSALISNRVGLFFDGGIISMDTPESFFSENNYYTTVASRMSRHVMERSVTSQAVIQNCLHGKEKVYG